MLPASCNLGQKSFQRRNGQRKRPYVEQVSKGQGQECLKVATNYSGEKGDSEIKEDAMQWKDEWPDAIMYGCPGLMQKKPEEGYEEEVGVDDAAPACWLGEIEVAHMKHEAVPIFNVPFFSEVSGLVGALALCMTGGMTPSGACRNAYVTAS